jgi:hypothetical protein
MVSYRNLAGETEDAERSFEAIREYMRRLPASEPGRSVRSMEREQIADMVAASEARSDTKLAEAMGEVRTEFANLRADIRELKASTASRGTVIGTGVTLFFGIAGLLIAFMTFGAQWFGLGLDASGAAEAGAQRALAAYTAAPTPPAGSATGK